MKKKKKAFPKKKKIVPNADLGDGDAMEQEAAQIAPKKSKPRADGSYKDDRMSFYKSKGLKGC